MERDTSMEGIKAVTAKAVVSWDYRGAKLFIVKFRGHYCGYCTLPRPTTAPHHEIMDYAINVHGGVTLFSTDRKTYGFDCDHYGDENPSSPTHDIDWVKAETERMTDQIIPLMVQEEITDGEKER